MKFTITLHLDYVGNEFENSLYFNSDMVYRRGDPYVYGLRNYFRFDASMLRLILV